LILSRQSKHHPRKWPKSNANFVTAGPKDVAAVVDIYKTWAREINRNFLQAGRQAWEID